MDTLYTAEDIKARLVIAFGADIGRYKTPTIEEPAIRIFDKKLPSEWSIIGSGIEVLIPSNPKRIELSSNMDADFFDNQWDVRVVLHKQGAAISPLLNYVAGVMNRDDLRCKYMQIEPSDMSSEQWVIGINQRGMLAY